MECLIKQVTGRSAQFYNLLAPNGDIIVPQVWESAVKPDMVVKAELLRNVASLPPMVSDADMMRTMPPASREFPQPPPSGLSETPPASTNAAPPAWGKDHTKPKKRGTRSKLKRFVPASLSGHVDDSSGEEDFQMLHRLS